jgi:DNA-binding NtrC family response regulator
VSRSESAGKVLLVDDEATGRGALARTLERWGFGVLEASDGAAGLALLRRHHPEVVISDLYMPGHDGQYLLSEGLAESDDAAFVIVSGRAGVAEAVEVMKAGAFDFLQKPVDLRRLRSVLERAVERQHARRELLRLRRELESSEGERSLLGRSEPLRALRELIARVGPTDASAVIIGESGTGKELVARALAKASPRAASPFVAINCAAVPGPLLESEFFGHEKGAFTGAVSRRLGAFDLADTGTLFLDEIGDLPLDLQAKLLRVLEDQRFRRLGGSDEVQVDVRVLAASNQDLQRAVAQNRFRLDLLYRLNVVTVKVPALRDRDEDVWLLAQHFLDAYRRRLGRSPATLSPEVQAALSSYAWPGNVRELRNVMERAAILSDGEMLRRRDLPEEIAVPLGGRVVEFEPDLTLAELERRYILETLRRCGGNQTRAGQRLGVTARTLYNKLQKWGIDPGPG